MLEALGKYVVIKYYVYVNHSGNMTNRRWHSDIIFYIKIITNIWYNKCHNRVKDSSLGPEFVFLRISTETIEALPYKFRRSGVMGKSPQRLFLPKKESFIQVYPHQC